MGKLTKRLLAFGMAAVMSVTGMVMTQPLTEVQAQVQSGLSDLSREAAAEGIVMLKNDNQVLPLSKGGEPEGVSVFGRVQVDYFDCGYGSGGDVNKPYTVNLLDGLRNNPAIQINEKLAAIYEDWCANNVPDEGWWGNWPLSHPEMPLSDEVVADAAEATDTAVVVIGRSSGEDRDSQLIEGSWYLTPDEKSMLSKVNDSFENVVVLLNVGTLIDMSWVADYDNLDSILFVWQGGMESGNAVADVLSGDVTPSGKLSQTIANIYEDYPSSANNGRRDYNNYVEDIYVGYRYFETFAKDVVLYPFGYGMSYTDFSIETHDVTENDGEISVELTVTNTGDTYSGKEVVQIYYGAPQGVLGKAEKSLIAYRKTIELAPGESQEMTITFDADNMASYDDAGKTGHKSAYVLEAGDYPIYVGNSVRDAEQAGVYTEEELRVVKQSVEANAVEVGFDRMVNNNGQIAYEAVPTATVNLHDRILDELPEVLTTDLTEEITLMDVYNEEYALDDFIAQLSFEELEALSRGDYTMGSSLGPAGNAGVFGGTSRSLRDKGVVPVTTTDGPSGIRLSTTASLIPIGTCLACTWNDELVEELYELYGMEMILNGSDVLLAPGMNLQRDPLCGRNFEYFSEDPVLTGLMGANVVKGLQSQGVAACPKHFALNNQETSRNQVDSRCSERAQRELYLKGFEICIETANPLTLMASYNRLNGEYSHYHYELNKTILRDEFNYQGVVLTDWWMQEDNSEDMTWTWNNAYRVRAHVDVLMPGEGPRANDTSLADSYNNWVNSGSPANTVDSGITLGELQRNAKSILNFVMQSENFRTLNNLPTYGTEYAETVSEYFEVDTVPTPERPALESVVIDGKTLTAYNPLKKEYRIFVRNMEDLPTVEVTVSEEMEVELTQATAETNRAVAVVDNGETTNTYTFIFTNEIDLEPLGENPVYASVTGISVNGEEIYNFYPEVKSYSVNVKDMAGAEIAAETPEGVDAIITKYDTYAVVRAESDDQATEYRINFATAPQSDDFTGDTLNTDIWTLNNPDETHYEMTEEGFEITSQIGQYYGTDADNYVMNYLSQPAAGDWEATVVLNHAVPGGQVYQQFGIAAMQDEDNFVGVKYECNDWNDGAWEGITNVIEVGGSSSSNVLNQSIVSSFVNSGTTHDIYYRIRKVGNEYQLSASTDGTNYADMGTQTVALNDVKLVIFACNGMGTNRDGNTITPSEVPVLVKDVQVTDLTSYEQPEVTTVTISAAEDGAVTKLKGTSRFYQYGSDIQREASEDSEDPEGTAGEIIGFIRPGYYLLFDVDVEKTGHYTVAPRAAALDETGTIQYSYQLESDGELLASFVHGETGGWKEWVTQGSKSIYLTEGKHTFRLLYNSADINVNYLEFTYTPDDHTEEVRNAVDATADKDGYAGDIYCKVCDKLLEEGETIPKFEQPVKLPYTDVNENDWYYDSVYWAYVNGVALGTTSTSFTPNGKCTRAEIVTFLWRAAGSPEPTTDTCTFADVQSNEYYYNAVLWAVENGITYGETNTRFAPNKQCTRAEIVTFLWRGAGSPDAALNECQFTDVQTNGYYYEAVLWAVENQITSGQTTALFGTDAVCTRAEAVTFIGRSAK